MSERVADYVVVGAGTAGCVVASRLSADASVTVALLEAGGPDTNPAIYAHGLDPMFSLWNPQGDENWGYATVPQAGLDGRSIDIARGRVLGGSSAVNAMIFIRGHRRDYDHWASLGNVGWSYDEVLPYFLRSETYHGTPSPYRGDDGPLSVIDYRNPSPVGHAFIGAAAELGARQQYNDLNGECQEAGAGFYNSTRTPDGTRVTAASAFVTPVLSRANLQVLTHVRATRIVIEDGRARGVEIVGPEGVQTIRAEREVIVACGAFESPKLLMLSGVGRADHLRGHGVGVVADLPGVGTNLQDHLLLGVAFESLVPLDPPEMLAEAGLCTFTGLRSCADSPDLQYFFGPVQFVAPEYTIDGPGFTFAPILSQPASRGTVTLASADPTDRAVVDPCYLSDEDDYDLAVFEHGIRYARELAATSAFDGLRGRELAPGPDVSDRDGLRAYIRASAGTVWHPAGTCRMGHGDDAVVDDHLRVHGIDDLRVVDASIMPRLVNANPNAAIMMIAEKAADMILAAER
jgi:choline dehydrogenase